MVSNFTQRTSFEVKETDDWKDRICSEISLIGDYFEPNDLNLEPALLLEHPTLVVNVGTNKQAAAMFAFMVKHCNPYGPFDERFWTRSPHQDKSSLEQLAPNLAKFLPCGS